MTAPKSWGDVPNNQFCDVVMEGGITSGIIYASAASELAKHYRFRSVGGSSIGAFAAAVTAAAEYSRRNGSDEGFKLLAGLPDELKEEEGRRGTLLRRLFVPQKKTRRLFGVFLAIIGHDNFVKPVLCGFAAALRQYWLLLLLALVVATALTLGPLSRSQFVAFGSWLFVVAALYAIAIVTAPVAGIIWDILAGLVPNGFGLCRGWSWPLEDKKDLAGYLFGAIQKAACRDPESEDHRPLTFKELWDAPDSPTTVLGYVGSRRSIDLQVYSTNLAHSRPYRFPLDNADDMGRLFFRLEDMQQYFPEPIWRHLAAYARPYEPKAQFDPPASKDTEQFLELPHEHLPVAVAARLALSFPFLISAVPLWAMDYQRDAAKSKFSKCWMSDGGLCTNFPIHLFDSFLPKWPTFGISLHTREKSSQTKAQVRLQTREKSSPTKAQVWLPQRHMQGRADLWHRIEGGRFSQLRRFVLGLWMATWRWNDMTMMRMPGVRDRVVRIFLEENEGGVNIKMSPAKIKKLADVYGRKAAQAFVKKFAAPRSHGWLEHRWVRFNRLLNALREQIEGFEFSAKLKEHAEPLDIQIDASRYVAPLRGYRGNKDPDPSESSLSAERALELRELLVALTNLEAAFRRAGDHKPYHAKPRPSLRVRHPT